MEPEALLTVQEAAASIGVTEAAIRHATLGGKLPFIRKYGRNLIETSQLQAYRVRLERISEQMMSRTLESTV